VVSVIEEKKGSFVKKQRQREIRCSSDIVEQLQILLEENTARIGGGVGYQFEIQTMIELFTAAQDFPDQEREEVDKYLSSLRLLVDELNEALQEMTFDYDGLAHWLFASGFRWIQSGIV
jgi:hypothetical protein